MAFSGTRLLWTEAATVRVDPHQIAGSPAGARRFDYYRAEAFRVSLNRASTRFVGDVDTPVSVRTSIAAMRPGVLSPTGDGGFVMLPESRRFAVPVIWCCSADDREVVVESDGREDAPHTVGAAWGVGSVRYVQSAPAGVRLLRVADPSGAVAPTTQTTSDATATGLVGVSADAVGWVDPASATTFLLRGDGAEAVSVALPGPGTRVWASPGLFAVAVRIGGRIALVRIDQGPSPRAVTVWVGARLPRVALGGHAIAVAERRRVLASRRGPVRLVVVARRVVEAIGVDDRRLAWIERASRRGARVGVIRLGRVR
jgi:hypothetical protein